MRDLFEIRDEIDKIDNQIVDLYEQRVKLVSDVAEYKINTGKKVFDKEREKAKLDALSQKAGSPFTRLGILELFEQIMSNSRKKQYQLLTEHGIVEKIDFETVEELDFKGARIVFQGVDGAYSQQAMRAFFGSSCDEYNVETFKDAMEEIRNGNADYAVLPLENSSAGIVPENYDLLVEYDNTIVGEQILKIEHALLTLQEAKLSDITHVYSHPQALMQCSAFFDEHKDCEKISVKNTAVAAKKVKEDGLCSQAAVASAVTADIYGLKVMQEAIQNNKNNSTRFIIVTGKKISVKKNNKISVCFESPHQSGSLYHMLSHFIYNGINMTNIQSRPIPGKDWDYRFFVDFEGRLNDTAVLNALRGLKDESMFFKILGTY